MRIPSLGGRRKGNKERPERAAERGAEGRRERAGRAPTQKAEECAPTEGLRVLVRPKGQCGARHEEERARLRQGLQGH